MLPIIYPPECLRNETFRTLLSYNPFAAFVVLIRAPVAEAQVPSLSVWLLATGSTVVAMLVAAVAVRGAQRRIIFHL
jgi:ABC-type polysaccharide/polyol phosphate export permease